MERALGFAVCAISWTSLCLAFLAVLAAARLGAELEAKDKCIEGLYWKCRALAGITRGQGGRCLP